MTADDLRARVAGYLRWLALRHDHTFTNTSGTTTMTVAGPVIVHYPEAS